MGDGGCCLAERAPRSRLFGILAGTAWEETSPGNLTSQRSFSLSPLPTGSPCTLFHYSILLSGVALRWVTGQGVSVDPSMLTVNTGGPVDQSPSAALSLSPASSPESWSSLKATLYNNTAPSIISKGWVVTEYRWCRRTCRWVGRRESRPSCKT